MIDKGTYCRQNEGRRDRRSSLCLNRLLTRLSQWPVRLRRGRSQNNSPTHTTKTTMHSFHKKPLRKFGAIRCFAGAIAAFSLVVAVSPGEGLAQDKAAVLLPGSINDQSWNAQGYSGVKKLKSMGWDVAYSENVQPSDMAEALQDYSRKGYTLIIGHTGRFLSPMELVGPKYPKTTFIVGSGNAGAGKNVASIDFNNTQTERYRGVRSQCPASFQPSITFSATVMASTSMKCW